MKNSIQCIYCNKQIPPLGIFKHLKVHNKTILEFKKEFFENLIQNKIADEIVRMYNAFESIDKISKKVKIPSSYVESLLKYLKIPKINLKKIQEEKWKRLSEFDKKELIRLYVEENYTINDISSMSSFNSMFLCARFKEIGIKLRRPIKKQRQIQKIKTQQEFNTIIDDYNQGATLRFLEQKYKIERNLLKKCLIEKGIRIRTQGESASSFSRYRKKNGIFADRKFTYNSGHVPWYFINGKKFQGSYEALFALWLTDKKIEFETHCDIERIKYLDEQRYQKSYYPDFKIISDNCFFPKNCFIEIKGIFLEKDKIKMKLVKEQHKDKQFIVVFENNLKKLGVFNIEKKLNLNLIDFRINRKNENLVQKLLADISKDQLVKVYLIEKQNLDAIAKKWFAKDVGLLKRVFEIYKIPLSYEKTYDRFCVEFYNNLFGDLIVKEYCRVKNLNKIALKFKFISRHFLRKILKQHGVSKTTDIYSKTILEDDVLKLVLKTNSINRTSLKLKANRIFVEKIVINKLRQLCL